MDQPVKADRLAGLRGANGWRLVESGASGSAAGAPYRWTRRDARWTGSTGAATKAVET